MQSGQRLDNHVGIAVVEGLDEERLAGRPVSQALRPGGLGQFGATAAAALYREAVALVVVGVGGLVWLVGMQRSRDLHLPMAPHGLTGGRAFVLVTVGTLLLAAGALSLGVTLHR